MNDRAVALLVVGSVAAASAILMRDVGGMRAALADARHEWSRLSLSARTTLSFLFALYSVSHAIQWRWVLLTQGVASVVGLVVSAVLPWLVSVLVFFGSGGWRTPLGAAVNPGPAIRKQPMIACVAFSVSVSVVWALWRSNGNPLIIDEALLLFQAKLLQHSTLALSVPESWEPFFAVKQAVVAHGRVYSQYPPGWPAMLAAWSTVAPTWLLGPALVGALVLSTLQVGRCLYGATVGMIAAGLVATSASLLYWGASLMSDLPTACLIAASAAALGASVRGPGRTRSVLLAVLSGAFLGLTFAARPLTALSAAPLVLVVAILTNPGVAGRRPRFATSIALMFVGALPMLVGLLAYNHATNGDALVFGYARANGGLHSLGFGLRGFIEYTDAGRATPSVELFTLRDSLLATGRQFAAFNQSLLGGFFLPVFSAAVIRRTMPRNAWLLVAAAAVLPLVHLMWFFTDTRYYLPLVPFLAVVVAAGIGRSLDVTAPAFRKVAAVLILCNLALMVSGMILDGFWSNPLLRTRAAVRQHAALDARRRAGDSTVVFVFDPGTQDLNLWRLYPLNADHDARRPIMVVRDLGRANDDLLRDLRGWSVACIDAARPEMIRMISPGQPPTCRSTP